jgi:hypothetical protein
MTAFRATFSDMKLVKTRQVAQLIFEIPLSDFDAAYEVLGGMPNPANERWFGIAPLRATASAPPPVTPPLPAGATKRDWRDIPPAQQAGIRCEEPSFVAFLREQRSDDWIETRDAAECVRLICGVQSRGELATNHKARVIWKQLDDQFQAWRQVEHA